MQRTWEQVEPLIDFEIRDVCKRFWDVGHPTQEGCSGHGGKARPYLIFLPYVFTAEKIQRAVLEVPVLTAFGTSVIYKGESLELRSTPPRHREFLWALEYFAGWLEQEASHV